VSPCNTIETLGSAGKEFSTTGPCVIMALILTEGHPVLGIGDTMMSQLNMVLFLQELKPGEFRGEGVRAGWSAAVVREGYLEEKVALQDLSKRGGVEVSKVEE
jgi:hypothetical protein